MKNIRGILCLISALALIGLGCSSPPSDHVVPPTPPQPTAPVTTQPATPPVATSTVDATWKTFTNKTLDFSFQYPPSGSLAPTFSVQFLKATDPKITAGCYADESVKAGGLQENNTLNGVEFCHTNFVDHAMSHAQEHDFWTTQKGNQYILVSFESQVYISNMSVIEGCEQGGKLVNTKTCKPFDRAAYQSLLLEIMSTFHYGQ